MMRMFIGVFIGAGVFFVACVASLPFIGGENEFDYHAGAKTCISLVDNRYRFRLLSGINGWKAYVIRMPNGITSYNLRYDGYGFRIPTERNVPTIEEMARIACQWADDVQKCK